MSQGDDEGITRRAVVRSAAGMGAVAGGAGSLARAQAAPVAGGGPLTGGARDGASADGDIVIVDSHCHATPAWYEPVESLVYQMDQNGVRHAILIQIGGYFDNEYQEESLRRYPGRFASVVLVDWTRPDAIQQLEALVAKGNVSGVRLRPESRSPGNDPLAIWRAAARLRLSISISGTRETFAADEWVQVIEAVPEVPIVIEHLGSANAPDGEPPPYPERRKILDLARYPNVYVKIHGLGEFARRNTPLTVPFPFEEPTPPFLDWAYDSFGPGRMMWGSDFSLVGGREGYRLALQLAMAHFAGQSQEDRRLIFGGTALSVFPVRA